MARSIKKSRKFAGPAAYLLFLRVSVPTVVGVWVRLRCSVVGGCGP